MNRNKPICLASKWKSPYSVLAAVLLVLLFLVSVYIATKKVPARAPEESLTAQPSQNSPSAQDGKGKAVVIPNRDVVVSFPGTWKLVFTVAETGIAMGGGVAFHISPFWGWTPPQNHSPTVPGYVTVSCSNRKADLDILTDRGNNYVIARTTNMELVSGDKITVIYGDTQGGKNPGARARADRYAEQGERFFIKVDGDGDGRFFAIKQHPAINILPGPASRLIVTAPSMAAEGVPFNIKVAAVDRMDNWVRSYKGRVTITSSPEGATFKTKPIDPRIRSFECTIPKGGPYQFFVHDSDNNLSGVSNPVLCKKQLPRFKLFWADLHGHSLLSDGTGTAEDYFHYARLVSGLDAAALTDHDAWGFEALDEHEEIWSFIKKTANRFYEPGRFVTFMGYEWTNWTYGHKHVLFLDEPAPLYSFRDPMSNSPDKLWKLLKSCRAMTISHHVGGGPIATDWNFHDPEMEPVVEVCSIHGNSEYPGAPSCIYRPQNGSFVRDALSRGYKLGIVAGGDTHNGHPGMGEPFAPTGGVMAFYAEELTREALWDALKKRRVYGTSGDRIIVDFKINGHWMGETVKGEQNSEREIYIRVVGTDRLKHVEIVKNNEQFKSWKENSALCEHAVKDRERSAKRDFYYLRVIQENGQMAWSSPIWFE